MNPRSGGWAPSGPASRLGVPGCPEPPGARWGGTGGELGHCQGGHFDHVAAQPQLRAERQSDASLRRGNLRRLELGT